MELLYCILGWWIGGSITLIAAELLYHLGNKRPLNKVMLIPLYNVVDLCAWAHKNKKIRLILKKGN